MSVKKCNFRLFCLGLIVSLIAPLVQANPIHSRPDAFDKIYMDFVTYPATSTPEQQQQTCDIVAQFFNRWDVDVTTEYPGVRGNVAWVILGGPITNGFAGIAGIGNFGIGITNFQFATGFAADVYSDGLGNDPNLVGRTSAHEIGHLLGLYHQSTWVNGTRVSEYSEGDGVTVPLMGDALAHMDEPAIWTVGINSNGQVQDDVAFISTVLPALPVPEPSLSWLIIIFAFRRRTV